jgi:hypothetical protein
LGPVLDLSNEGDHASSVWCGFALKEDVKWLRLYSHDGRINGICRRLIRVAKSVVLGKVRRKGLETLVIA